MLRLRQNSPQTRTTRDRATQVTTQAKRTAQFGQTEAQTLEQAMDVRRMVAHLKCTLDKLNNTLVGPSVAAQSILLGATSQHCSELPQLRLTQSRWRTAADASTQRCDPTFAGTFQPLADCAGRHIESRRNIALLPAHLAQLPGPQPAPLLPVAFFRQMLAHDERCRPSAPILPEIPLSRISGGRTVYQGQVVQGVTDAFRAADKALTEWRAKP